MRDGHLHKSLRSGRKRLIPSRCIVEGRGRPVLRFREIAMFLPLDDLIDDIRPKIRTDSESRTSGSSSCIELKARLAKSLNNRRSVAHRAPSLVETTLVRGKCLSANLQLWDNMTVAGRNEAIAIGCF